MVYGFFKRIHKLNFKKEEEKTLGEEWLVQ